MSQRPNTVSGSSDEPSDESYVEGLEDIVRPHLSRRRRLARAGLLVALVLVVAVGLVWRSAGAGVQNSNAAIVSPTFSPEMATALITSNVNFGVITVNGQKQSGPPSLIVRLRPGQNTIELDAAPFAPSTCTVTWPSGNLHSRSCSVVTLGSPMHVLVNGTQEDVGGQITIGADGATLSPSMCTNALDVVAGALNAVAVTTQVPAGQYIATAGFSKEGVPLYQRATASLHARLTAQVQDYDSQPCDTFQQNFNLTSGRNFSQIGTIWTTEISIGLEFVFIGLDGELVGQSLPGDGSIRVSLVVPSQKNPTWQLLTLNPSLSAQVAGAVCNVGTQALAGVYQRAYAGNEGYGIIDLGSSGIEGCRIELDSLTENTDVTANYIWRFGVLMASDATSQKFLPMLPLASAAELTAVSSGS